jgi:heptosyltransferase-1
VNILIIKPSSLGDVVQALPVLKSLQHEYPDARIDWLVNDELADILLENPYLHAVHRWDRTSWRKPQCLFNALRNAAGAVRELRRAKYDVVIDLQGLLRSALLAFLSGGKTVVGFADGREMAPAFYRKKVEAPTDEMHSVDRYVSAVGGDIVAEKEFSIRFSAEEVQGAEALLHQVQYGSDKPLALFVPSARWPTKRWPPESFAALAERVVGKEVAQVGVVGSGGDRVLTERIASLAECHVMDFSGRTTLKELAYLMSKADVVVGNDSGPMHLAAAVGSPVVALYGPTSALRTGPYGRNHTVLTSGLPCSPCFSRKCSSSAACMKSISVETVFEACLPYCEKAKRSRGSR